MCVCVTCRWVLENIDCLLICLSTLRCGVCSTTFRGKFWRLCLAGRVTLWATQRASWKQRLRRRGPERDRSDCSPDGDAVAGLGPRGGDGRGLSSKVTGQSSRVVSVDRPDCLAWPSARSGVGAFREFAFEGAHLAFVVVVLAPSRPAQLVLLASAMLGCSAFFRSSCKPRCPIRWGSTSWHVGRHQPTSVYRDDALRSPELI